MITIFNRKELIGTYDGKKQAEVRDLLSQFKIPYSINVVNRKSPSPFAAGSRARKGTFGENLQLDLNILSLLKRRIMKKQILLLTGKSKIRVVKGLMV